MQQMHRYLTDTLSTHVHPCISDSPRHSRACELLALWVRISANAQRFGVGAEGEQAPGRWVRLEAEGADSLLRCGGVCVGTRERL